jgi:hypothetical protein
MAGRATSIVSAGLSVQLLRMSVCYRLGEYCGDPPALGTRRAGDIPRLYARAVSRVNATISFPGPLKLETSLLDIHPPGVCNNSGSGFATVPSAHSSPYLAGEFHHWVMRVRTGSQVGQGSSGVPNSWRPGQIDRPYTRPRLSVLPCGPEPRCRCACHIPNAS